MSDEKLYAAGKYINRAPGDRDGVKIWAEEDGNIRDTDIVLWHTFGLTHIPRVEDFPLMSVEGASFMFRPSNFFTANPGMDVPPPQRKKC
ncbi:unnamed protein product [Orchesella dallaii]|uniref:Amine oxidase n=1 Tax=Orchesella dallaii TaxID=48710 RepID=A0ABP1R0R5_9HEXA